MEAGTSSETLAKFYHSTQCNISEANNLRFSIKLLEVQAFDPDVLWLT
jgi:hypothetical protein